MMKQRHALPVHDGGKILSGENALTIPPKNMENLYQRGFQEIKITDGNYFPPILE